MQTVADINEEYFGNDKSKNYLKNDYSRVLYGVVQRSVIINVLREASKARHNEQRKIDKNGNESIARGDFDPDNAGFLSSIYELYQKGMMVDVRQLLTPKEAGAGGKFVKDIVKLNTNSFLDYYKTAGAYTVPPVLFGKFLEEKKADESLSITDFIDTHSTSIDNVVKNLVQKAVDFQNKTYFSQIVADYQALKFHKDYRPEKYDITESTDELLGWKTTVTTRRDKATVEIKKIAESLNDFAEIIEVYQSLVSKNTNFYSTSWPLSVYVERSFALFAKDAPADVREKTSADIVKYLDPALRIVGWEHDHPEKK